MKNLIKTVVIVVGILGMSLAFANGQTTLPTRYPTMQQAVVIPGSIRSNIERLAASHNWKVIWNSPYDYTWERKVRIRAADFEHIVGTIFTDYPLQAVFYKGNKVIYVQPRTLR